MGCLLVVLRLCLLGLVLASFAPISAPTTKRALISARLTAWLVSVGQDGGQWVGEALKRRATREKARDRHQDTF